MQTFAEPRPLPAPPRSGPHVVVVGGGVGGLAAAVDLAGRGLRVTLCERQDTLGGKLRAVTVGGAPVDSGPTVFTMRSVFEDLYASVGRRLDEHLDLEPARILARHAWSDGSRLDLHADVETSRAEIAAVFGPREAQAYLDFVEHCRRIYDEVQDDFIYAQRPTLLDIARTKGLSALGRLGRIDAHRSVWRSVGSFFSTPHLQQLFARYATYTGASPFQAPGTLNLIAHVEQQGVWTVRGGMVHLARSLGEVAAELGVEIRLGVEVEALIHENGQVRGVRLRDGEALPADAVVLNADAAALAAGLFGEPARAAAAPVPPPRRSLSALTLSMHTRVPSPDEGGFPLVHHNVFFSDDYRGEFDDIFRRGRLPRDPTVYLCAQDRRDGSGPAAGPERLFTIVNAPARGDVAPLSDDEVEQCTRRTLERLERCGLNLQPAPEELVVTRPQDFDRLFPATGGALYGAAAHSWRSSFDRSGARSRLPGLYLAGGSVHPGAGLPMVALSGRLAAQAVVSDLRSTRGWTPTATPGGTSTSTAPTAASA